MKVLLSTPQFDDTSFLTELIDDFKKLIAFLPQVFGEELRVALVFETEVVGTEVIKVTLDGYILVLYVQVFKEHYPKNPSTTQKEKLNVLWDFLGHPENKVPI